MYDWQNFNVVFQAKQEYTYDHKTVDGILRHRKEFGGTLFFDRVWASVGLKQASKSYPPRSNHDLRALWERIVQTTAPDQQKLALLYYVSRDCKHLHGIDANFARKTYLPSRYQLLVSGLWELDHCQFTRALDHLTNPSLTPTFTDEILYTLITHSKSDDGLATAYYLTVLPPLQDNKTLEAYFSLLCRNSVVDAYQFCRRRGESTHRQLFEQLVICIHSEPASTSRAERALTLLGLPLSDEEEQWFEECLLHGKGAQYQQAKDSVMMRRIAMGKDHQGLAALDRLRGPKINDVNWDDVRTSFQRATAS